MKDMITIHNSYTRVMLFLLLLFLGFVNMSAQEKISGTIRGKNGEPLSNASIVVNGKVVQTSKENGTFNIDNADYKSVLLL